MSPEDVLTSRLALLRSSVRQGFLEAPEQVRGFLIRVVGDMMIPPTEPPLVQSEPLLNKLKALKFGGYPALASMGYCLACADPDEIDERTARIFLQGINWQHERSSAFQAELAGDAIALLGIADGLHAIDAKPLVVGFLEDAKAWFLNLLERHPGSDARIDRARLLAGDLLDGKGRFGSQLARSDDLYSAAFDLCLWATWPDALRLAKHPNAEFRRLLFKQLLINPAPTDGEVLHAAAWFSALDVLTGEIAAAVVPDVHQVAHIFKQTQGSFRRWRWEDKGTRKDAIPARWLIDKEADVQAFLLAVLYPYFGDQLHDEQYLQSFGLRQGRFDFAITSLRLIIEVKVLRNNNEMNKIEADIAEDLSLYFKEPSQFDSMIIYIYDDRDNPEPERYPAIRDALRRRSERISDVVIIQRPSMIPGRNNRSSE